MKQLARVAVPEPETEIVVLDEADESKPWMPRKYAVVVTQSPRAGEDKPTVRRAPFRSEVDMFEAFDELQLQLVRDWKSVRASLVAQFNRSLRQARRDDIASGTVNPILGTHISALDELRGK